MKDELITLLEEKRNERLAKDRGQRWNTRHTDFNNHIQTYLTPLQPDILPPCGTIVSHPVIRSLLLDTPIDTVIITAEMVHERLHPLLPEITKTWLESAKNILLAKMQEANLKDEVTARDLDLAILYFQCNRCNSTIGYPGILVHECTGRSYQHDPTEQLGSLDEFYARTQTQPWTADVRCRNDQWRRAIVQACGLDPDYATQHMMHELDPFLERPTYDAEQNRQEAEYHGVFAKPKRTVYTWMHAMQNVCGQARDPCR